MKLLPIPSLCLLVSAALAQSGEPPIYRQPLQPLSPSKRGVVFGARLAREFGRQCSRESPVGYWTPVAPSKVEVRRLECALPAWMKTRRAAGWDNRFSAYHFQYGALVRGKTRLIYVNALPDSPADADKRQVWRRGAEVVCDGGSGFWGVEFDPRTGLFQHAAANGFA